MGTFDSSGKALGEVSTGSDTRAVLTSATDLARLNPSDHTVFLKTPNTSNLHDFHIAGLTTLAGGLTGGALGAGYGLVAEATVQTLKFPLAIGLGAIGAGRMAGDLLATEARYMSMAGKYGVRGLAIGALIGATAYGAYEVKNYFEK